MFGRATITLGIGPHSSFTSFAQLLSNIAVMMCHILLHIAGVFTHERTWQVCGSVAFVAHSVPSLMHRLNSSS